MLVFSTGNSLYIPIGKILKMTMSLPTLRLNLKENFLLSRETLLDSLLSPASWNIQRYRFCIWYNSIWGPWASSACSSWSLLSCALAFLWGPRIHRSEILQYVQYKTSEFRMQFHREQLCGPVWIGAKGQFHCSFSPKVSFIAHGLRNLQN